MAADPVLPAESDDPAVFLGSVVELARGPERGRVERLGADEDLVAAGAGKKLDEVFLALDLRVALDEEREPDLLRDHRLEQRPRLRILIEVVRREHDESNARVLRGAECRERRLDRLAPHVVARDLDY